MEINLKPKRESRKVQSLQLHDASAKPGVQLMESIAHYRHPADEALAILDAWTPRLVIPVLTAPAHW